MHTHSTETKYTTRDALELVRSKVRDTSITFYDKLIITISYGTNDARDPALSDQVHAYIHICVHAQTCAPTLFRRAYIHTCIHNIHGYIHTHVHTYMHTYTHIYSHVFIIAYARSCMNTNESFVCNMFA